MRIVTLNLISEGMMPIVHGSVKPNWLKRQFLSEIGFSNERAMHKLIFSTTHIHVHAAVHHPHSSALFIAFR
jgi:hypothetical protein